MKPNSITKAKPWSKSTIQPSKSPKSWQNAPPTQLSTTDRGTSNALCSEMMDSSAKRNRANSSCAKRPSVIMTRSKRAKLSLETSVWSSSRKKRNANCAQWIRAATWSGSARRNRSHRTSGSRKSSCATHSMPRQASLPRRWLTPPNCTIRSSRRRWWSKPDPLKCSESRNQSKS